jgi:hypothetical protein
MGNVVRYAITLRPNSFGHRTKRVGMRRKIQHRRQIPLDREILRGRGAGAREVGWIFRDGGALAIERQDDRLRAGSAPFSYLSEE